MLLPALTLVYFFGLYYLFRLSDFKTNISAYIFAALVSFFLLQTLRVYCQMVFLDIPNYNLIFNDIKPLDFVIRNGYGLEYYEESEDFGGLIAVPIEVGFTVLISIFKLFSNSFYLFLFFISIFQLFIFIVFCNRTNINIASGMAVYVGLTYITFQIGMLRQALAFCFFLIALLYGTKKFYYLLFILVGFAFHRSLLFCLPFVWVNSVINRRVVYFISIFALFIYLFKIDIVSQILYSSNILANSEFGKIDFYMNVDRSNNYLGIGFWERLILLFLINYAYINFTKRGLMTTYRNMFFNLAFFLIILQLFFFASPTITSRLRYYIVMFPLFFLWDYIHFIKDKDLKRVSEVLMFSYLLFQLYFLSSYLID